MLSRLINSLLLIIMATLATSALADDLGAPPEPVQASSMAAGLAATDPLDALPVPPEAPARWTADRPRTMDFLMRDLGPLALEPYRNPRPGALDHYLDVNRLYEPAPMPIAPRSLPEPPPASAPATSLETGRLETSGLFVDQRLALSGGLAWDRTIYDPYWSNQGQPEGAVTTMTYGFGADLAINDEWTAAASLTGRETTTARARPDRQFPGAGRLQPSDLLMGRLGLQLLKPDWAMRARLTAYAGRMGQTVGEGDPKAGLADLRGLELSLQKRLLDGRLSVELAAMLNYLSARQALELAPLAGRNLSAYLGLTFTDPALLNASLFLRHSDGGLYVNDYLLGAMGSSTLWDAKVWRDFAVSPALTLTTQIYGSSLIEAWFENLSDSESLPSSPYVEGRVTMSYSF